MGAIRSALYSRYGETADTLSDQIDSLEVMAGMFGYDIDTIMNEDGSYSALFFKQKMLFFDLKLSAIVGFQIYCPIAKEKFEQMRRTGEVRLLVELREGLVIAQSLL